jgi:hypothetical protein
MEKKMKKQTILAILIVALAAVACGGQTSQSTPQPVDKEGSVVLPVTAPVEKLAAEPRQVEQQADPSALIDYTAPEGLFTLNIPAAWSKQTDNKRIENTVVETITSPDGNAFVQVLTNRVNNSMNQLLKSQVTLDYMKRLYGKDMRVATDVTLDDGREKLEWWSDGNETNGTTYFNRVNKYLFFYTVGYKDSFEDDYSSLLKEVADSFSY